MDVSDRVQAAHESACGSKQERKREAPGEASKAGSDAEKQKDSFGFPGR